MHFLNLFLLASTALILASCGPGHDRCQAIVETALRSATDSSAPCTELPFRGADVDASIACLIDRVDDDLQTQGKLAKALTGFPRGAVTSALLRRAMGIGDERLRRLGAIYLFVAGFERHARRDSSVLPLNMLPLLIETLTDTTDIVGTSGRSDAPRYAVDFAAVSLVTWVENDALPLSLKLYHGYSRDPSLLRSVHADMTSWWTRHRHNLSWDPDLEQFTFDR